MGKTDAPSGTEVHVGLDLGGTKIFGALVGADGALSDETYREHERVAPAPLALTDAEKELGPAYANLLGTAHGLLAAARQSGRFPVGVGVGAPGMTRPDGFVFAAGGLGWKNVPLGQMLESHLELPVRVENDVNLAALGEYAVGAGRGVRSLFLMSIGTGIGGGIVVDGRLWRGHHFAAGELGALLPGREFLGWTDKDWGAFEAVASGSGLLTEAAKEAVARGESTGPARLTGERLFAEGARGTPWAKAVVDRAVDLWTVGLAAVQAILDPERVVLSGGVAPSVVPLLPEMAARLRQALPFAPEIVPSSLGYRAAVLGAPALFAQAG